MTGVQTCALPICVFSKFHVILATAGIEEGTNVFSFEIHRGLNGSSSDAVVFDATGVFGV